MSTTDRDSLKEEIGAAAEEGRWENWDGEGALPISLRTADIAWELARLLPSDPCKPDVSATPNGEIDFDWTIERGLGLTISVGPEGDIVFAGIFHGAKLSGTEPWKGVLPGFVECCLARLQREAG